MKTAKELIAEAKENGIARLSGSMDLCTSEYMQAEQEGWDNEDESKDSDLTTSPYWVWGDGVLSGIDTAEELEKLL